MNRNIFRMALACLIALTHSNTFAQSAEPVSQTTNRRKPSAVERPPQFVLLAFDGSSSLDMWRESVAFAKTVKTKNLQNEDTTIKFSYFINPVYYIERSNKQAYQTPLLNKPYSCIGWASPIGSVLERVRLTNAAFVNGHEIGSHANSHCSADGSDQSELRGKNWSEENWTSEFEQFNNLLFNALSLNNIKTTDNFVMKFTKNDIVGFRAPALATTQGLWPTLKKFGFKYDTSKIDKPNYWPVKAANGQLSNWGGWNIPLANIKVAGSAKRTLSMDYNWFILQTAGESVTTPEKCANDPDFKNNRWCKSGVYLTTEKYAQIKNQMLDSYKYYFKNNYFGGRAPLQIGHHFSKWNGGAYWQAMKEFAQFVCNKHEVKCVTIAEYVTWLDGLAPSELNAYRAGQFSKLADDKSIKDISAELVMPLAKINFSKDVFKVAIQNKDAVMVKSLKLKKQLSVDFKPVVGETIKLSDLKKYAETGSTALVRAALVNSKGEEVSWETFKVTNVGTPEQKVSEQSIEHGATQPETSDAHLIEQ